VSMHVIKHTHIYINAWCRVSSSHSACTNSCRAPEIQAKPTDHII
jgi:hypothetical protein